MFHNDDCIKNGGVEGDNWIFAGNTECGDRRGTSRRFRLIDYENEDDDEEGFLSSSLWTTN